MKCAGKHHLTTFTTFFRADSENCREVPAHTRATPTCYLEASIASLMIDALFAASMITEALFAASCKVFVERCAYRWLTDGLLCPRHIWISYNVLPELAKKLANE